MMATHNVFSPSRGKPILTPSQDIVLGSYFLTMNPKKEMPEENVRLPLIASLEEALQPLEGIQFHHPTLKKKVCVCLCVC